GDTALAQARQLLAGSQAQLLVLTLGSAGACLLVRDGRVWRAREAQPLAVVDTVGAGDSFLAGLLAAMLRAGHTGPERLSALDDAGCRHLLVHALASASLCVMQRGCVPPSWSQVCDRVLRAPAVIDSP
ncbi:MAG: carbohydrate kinase family protein, partial [Rhodoferax sp.]